MKVLFIYSGNSGSGKNNIVESQAASLVAAGVEIALFPLKGKGFWGYFTNIRKVSRFISLQSFDIIHAHYGLSAIVAFIAKRNEKLIVSFMGDDLVGTNNFNGTIKLWSRILIRLNVLFARWMYCYSIVKTQEMEGKLLKHTAFSLIPNGVDFRVFRPVDKSVAREQLGIKNDNKIVLFVSDPKRAEKNYLLSESAVKLVDRKEVILVPVFNVELETLNLYYNGADLLLLTSYHEGSPNVVKEAMACGCPVVSTDVGDVKWLFGEIPGYYITSFNPPEVAKKIKLALEFHNNHLNTSGRERISELGLDSKTIATKIIEVYIKVLYPILR